MCVWVCVSLCQSGTVITVRIQRSHKVETPTLTEAGACHWGPTWFVGSYAVLSQQDCVSPCGTALLLLVQLHEAVTSLNARPFMSSP